MGKWENIIKFIQFEKDSNSTKVSTCNSGSDALLLTLLLDKIQKDIYITTPISYYKLIYTKISWSKSYLYRCEKDGYIMCLKELRNF